VGPRGAQPAGPPSVVGENPAAARAADAAPATATFDQLRGSTQ